LGTVFVAKRNTRIYLEHSRSIALLLRTTYTLLVDTASRVLGDRSYWCAVIDIVGWGNNLVAFYCNLKLVGYLDPRFGLGIFISLVPSVIGIRYL